MINQDLIDTIEDCVTLYMPVDAELVGELLDNYKKLVESNAGLHKELVKVRVEGE